MEKAEESTRDQASNANWYYLREKRFTANLNNKLRQRNPKTTRGFQSFAKSLVFGDEKQKKDKVLQVKLSHGRYHEPIALEKYTTYMKMVLSRNLLIENCGFAIAKMQKLLIPVPPHFLELQRSNTLMNIKTLTPKISVISAMSSAYPMIQILETLLSTEITVIMIWCKCKLPCQHKHGVIIFFTPLRVWLLIAYHSTVFIGKI